MAANVHILTGPPGPGLTGRLLAEYLSRARELGAVLWLAPTERAANETLRRIADVGRPVLAPNVFTTAGFAHAILTSAVSGWSPPSPSRRRLLLDETVGELVRRRQLLYFRRVADTRGFLTAVEGFLAELEAVGLAPEQLATAVAGLRSAKLTGCAELATALVARDSTAIGSMAQAIQLIADRLPAPFDRIRFVFVDDCTACSPVEWQMVLALAKRAELRIALPEDCGHRNEAYFGVQRIRDRLPTAVVHSENDPQRDRPAALAHLDRHLFGQSGSPATDSTGLHLIEAPGPVGEARLVARRIRNLIAAGTRADEIVVTARSLAHSCDLLEEVLAEYGLPVDADPDRSLLDSPAIATLLRAARLPDEGWPFAAVTALLRNTYFRPRWPEGDSEVACRAEGLLRLLGEPRDKDAYLKAVRDWEEAPPEPLEDEGPDESRRLRKSRLARECRPFLERFFATWDSLPADATPAGFAAWLRQFASAIGLEAAEADDERALRGLWRALDRWQGPAMPRAAYLRGLSTVCASEPLSRATASGGRVRVVVAEEARHLDCEYLFVMGLGEKSFPRLAGPPSLLDDADRTQLRRAGLPFPDPSERLGTEQLLFLDLIARPRRGLVLSYPAIDDKGQRLLPGSFLRAVHECFATDALVPEQQRMLIEGYTKREPLSPAEARVQFAAALRGRAETELWQHPDLAPELCLHLRWADEVAAARFRSRDYNRYDGWLETDAAAAEVRKRFGPTHVFSSTALETYVACPFRFLSEHVLKLEELDEPGDEVARTRRGAAYHRALARLHRMLQKTSPDITQAPLPDTINPALLTQLDQAIQEYADRAASAASRKLWELEGKRLRRAAARYRDHWDEYLEPWRKVKAVLSPRLVEAGFGVLPDDIDTAPGAPLVVSVGGIEVRIGGRIDRVDVAEIDGELGFWVIDYKTGRATSYTSTSLARFEKLQLTLYALAVEKVFFPGRKARPLGLAYWMVTDTGPKGVLPRQAMAWLSDPDAWKKFRDQLESWVATIVVRLREGRFPLAPRSDNCTETCPFGQMCRISQSRNTGKVWDLRPVTGGALAAEDPEE